MDQEVEIMVECGVEEIEKLLKILEYRPMRGEVKRTPIVFKPLAIHILSGTAVENMTPIENVLDLSIYKSGIAIDIRPTIPLSEFSPRLSKIIDIKRFSIRRFKPEVLASYTRFQFDVPHSAKRLAISRGNAEKFVNDENFKIMKILVEKALSSTEFPLELPAFITTYINLGATNLGYGVEITKWIQENIEKNSYKSFIFQIGPTDTDKDEIVRRLEYIENSVFNVGGVLSIAVDAINHTIVSSKEGPRKITIPPLEYGEINYSIPKIIVLLSSLTMYSWFRDEYYRLPEYREVVNIIRSGRQILVSKPMRTLADEEVYWFGDIKEIVEGESEVKILLFGFMNVEKNQYKDYIDKRLRVLKNVFKDVSISVEPYILGTKNTWFMFGIELPPKRTILDLYKKYNKQNT